MLSFNNVEFNFKNQPVFNELNLNIEESEFVFLIGKSGAGKTTLLQMIYMNLLPQSGYIQFDIYSSDTIKPKKLPNLRRNIGIIFQDFKLLEDRTVFENLAFVLEITGAIRKDVKQKVYQVLSEVGLAHKQKNKINQLSGGEMQRIAIARAIINEPKLIIADEPTGNLDPETSREIVDILYKISSRGTSVLIATHNYELVKKYKSRIIRLINGKAEQVDDSSKL
ncbi:MAG: ATP-binding cassette domain-containing protein [Bacteroidetes bacterium]|nr:ATP-binding cassette domain-containing protein [Bacteroidota bacterium]MBU1113781.1 ATP-binding cassette domain-containing protein [Bacteroidota bacterium]MBU1800350.1 ATP-binding cassette domain-containing protein [Bacteroidota bacterium]